MPRISKETAWSVPIEEKNIPIDRKSHPVEITRNWFRNRNQTTFSTYLPPKFDGSKPVNMIQIGVFEGADLVWNFQNILKHPDSRVLAIDPWASTTKLDAEYMEAVRQRALKNLAPYKNKIHIVRGYSQQVLEEFIKKPFAINGKLIPPGHWNLITVDGAHESPAVYQDAVLSLELCKVNGWLLFDDVRNNHYKKFHVDHALEQFERDYGDKIKLVWFHRYMNCYEKMK